MNSRVLFHRATIQGAALLLTAWDLLFFIFWYFNVYPVLAGAIPLFRAISRFRIARFDQFDHFEPPDLIDFSSNLICELIRGSIESKTKSFSTCD